MSVELLEVEERLVVECVETADDVVDVTGKDDASVEKVIRASPCIQS